MPHSLPQKPTYLAVSGISKGQDRIGYAQLLRNPHASSLQCTTGTPSIPPNLKSACTLLLQASFYLFLDLLFPRIYLHCARV